MSQTFSFESPATSPFRLDANTLENLSEYAEPEVPDRELELFESLHSDIEPEAEPEPEPEYDEPPAEEYEGDHPVTRFFRVPLAAVEALGKGSYAAALALLGSAGHRSENDLTNVIFYFRRPEALGRKIQPHERDLQRDWLQIRDTVVRPTLARRTSVPAADAAIRMLAAARADLEKEGHTDLVIGITSAYRSADEQFAIWQGKGRGGKRGFPYYYNETAGRRAATGDPHGPAAVLVLAKVMKKHISAPGFSNHQDGLALDLGTATWQPAESFGPEYEGEPEYLDDSEDDETDALEVEDEPTESEQLDDLYDLYDYPPTAGVGERPSGSGWSGPGRFASRRRCG